MTATLSWDFPLPRPHTGVPLGNGTLGVLVWGDDALHLTIGRAGFWDRRGGNAFTAAADFALVRRLLEAGDHAALREVFAVDRHGKDHRPYQIGNGRLEIRFPSGHRPVQAQLHTATGTVRVQLVDGAGRWATVIVRVDAEGEMALIELPEGLEATITGRPAWDFCGETLARRGVTPPERWSGADAGGWVQTTPADQALACAWTRRGRLLIVATALADSDARARAEAAVAAADPEAITKRCVAFWHRVWQDLPRVELPDPVVQHAWDLGVFRFNAAMAPGAVPCTLQGPWLEETQLPPWSCDYHFNINVQMIHLPGLPLGRTAALAPMWDLLRGWLPGMREAGRAFFKADDAVMLPHAVDDRCQAVGGFWTGMIDHACTGWMALLAFDQWRHDGDRKLLDEIVWPLLTGAFAGYWAMSDRRDGRITLPVTTSPEFRGHQPNAWGPDASFQLACWHAVVRALPEAAKALGRPVDPRWAEVARDLPAASTVHVSKQIEWPQQQVDRIGLWDGLDLIESHRHHSHLAGLWPFRTLDPADPRHRTLLEESMYHWVRTGAGAWSGWSVPWAAVLCARMGWADGAVTWLRWWTDVFTNQGHGTLHDGHHHGQTTLVGTGEGGGGFTEIFQLDAGMGAITAISELLVQERGQRLHVLPRIPVRWRQLRFDGIWCPGGIRIGATVLDGRVAEVRIAATRGGRLDLDPGMGTWTCDGRIGSGPLVRDLAAEERIVLRIAP